MKIKPSNLEHLIKEEIQKFFEGHGSFPDEQLTSTELQNQEECSAGMYEMKSDLKLIYGKLFQHLGPEKLLEEIVKNINPRMLREAFDSIVKLYGVKVQ